MSTAAAIRDHLDRPFRSLLSGVLKASDDAWACRDDRLKGVWQWTAHACETAESYVRGDQQSYPWSKRLGIDWEDTAAPVPPTREALLAFIADVRAVCSSALDGVDDARLLAPIIDDPFPWCGGNLLGRYLLVMRHTQAHVGDINRVLRFHGCQPCDWC